MKISRFLPSVCLVLFASLSALNATVSFPAGPLPSGRAPAAVAYSAASRRAYVVHREFYNAIDVNTDLLPTDRVTVLNSDNGNIIASVNLPHSINGQSQGIALDQTHNRLFVTNPDDNSLCIIDANKNEIVATVGAGQFPTALALDPVLNQLFVANAEGVTVLDSSNGTQLRSIPLSSGTPRVLAVDPNSHLAYVASSLSPKLVVIDGTNLSITGQIRSVDGILGGPSSISVDPSYRVYVAFPGANLISSVDISGAVPFETARFSAGEQPTYVAVDENSHAVYVAAPNSNKVGIYDSGGYNLASVGLRFPTSLAMDPTSSRAFVTTTLSDSLAVVDTTSKTLSNRLVLGTLAFGLCCESAASRVYVANFAADCISVLDETNHAYLTNWACGSNPWTLATDEAQRQLYTLNGDGSVSVVSCIDGGLKSKLNVGPNPRCVIISTNWHRVFITSDSGLTVLDSISNSVLTNIVTGIKPVGIAVDEPNRRLYVATQLSGRISVVDAATFQILSNWQPVRSNVWALALDPSWHRLYVTVPPAVFGGFNGLEILNSDTGEFLGEIPSGGTTISERTAGLVAVDNRLHYAYMTEPDNGLVYVAQDTNLVATVALGTSPHGLALDEVRGLVFVANALDGTISVIDPSTFGSFRIIQIAPNETQAVLTWTTQPGSFYQMQSKPTLVGLPWTNVGPMRAAASTSMSATDSFNLGGSAFYRVVRSQN